MSDDALRATHSTSTRQLLTAPALAVAAALLAWATMGGFSLLSGSTYLSPVSPGTGLTSDTRQLLSNLLGAGLSLLPFLLGRASLARSTGADPSWVGALARGAMIVSVLAAALRVAAGVVQLVTTDAGIFTYG